jgi:hypothetical protein
MQKHFANNCKKVLARRGAVPVVVATLNPLYTAPGLANLTS